MKGKPSHQETQNKSWISAEAPTANLYILLDVKLTVIFVRD